MFLTFASMLSVIVNIVTCAFGTYVSPNYLWLSVVFMLMINNLPKPLIEIYKTLVFTCHFLKHKYFPRVCRGDLSNIGYISSVIILWAVACRKLGEHFINEACLHDLQVI